MWQRLSLKFGTGCLLALLALVGAASVAAWAQPVQIAQGGRRGGGGGSIGRGPRGPGAGALRGDIAKQRAGRQELTQFRALDRLSRMAPEDRERLLSRLPAARRRTVESSLQRFQAMPPERRQLLERRLRQFQGMTPERQNRLRTLTREMMDLPPERRNVLRREFGRLQGLSDEDRMDYTERQAFREQFSERERELLLELVEIAPPRGERGPAGSGMGRGRAREAGPPRSAEPPPG